MAGGTSNYKRGEMNVDDHTGTFGGFMDGTKYGGAAIALVVILPTLIFAVGIHWFSALIATFILGVVMGVAMKLKGAWYGGLIATSILVAIVCAILSAIA